MTYTRRHIIETLVLTCALLALPATALPWQVEINGSASGFDQAAGVAVDGSNDVVAVGRLLNTLVLEDLTVVKIDGLFGTETWRREIDGTAAAEDDGLAVALDASGDVFVSGSLKAPITGGNFVVIKLAGATGAELWRQGLNGTANGLDQGLTVVVDGNGDVIAGGFIDDAPLDGNFTVVKFAGATGTELWRREIDGTAGDLDKAAALAVTSSNDIVAAGQLVNAGTDGDFTVMKLASATGADVWRRELDGMFGGFDQATAVTVDGADDVVAAGWIKNPAAGTAQDLAVVKLAGATGVDVWRREVDSVVGAFDAALGVRVDGANDVIAVGSLTNTTTGSDGDLIALKLASATGTELWRTGIAGSAAGGMDEARVVAVDGAGDLVVGGVLVNTTTGSDFTIVKLSNAAGAELWRTELDGSASGGDEVLGLAVDAFGDVLGVGFLANTGGLEDFTVIKLKGFNGTDFEPPVCGNGIPEAGEECDDGNTADGDCCSSSCTLDAVGTPCTGDGVGCTIDACDGAGTCLHSPDHGACDDGNSCTDDVCNVVSDCIITPNTAPCDDGDACTENDTCAAGTCQSGAPVVCAPCEACDSGLGGCVPTPMSAAMCKQPTVPTKAQLQLKDSVFDKKDKLAWKWTKGETTSVADLGDPLSTDDYVLCVFDESTSTTSLVLRAHAPAGGVCGSNPKPCWKGLGNPPGSKGYKYNDRDGTPDGFQKLVIKPGDAGRAKITLKGQRENLVMPGENAHAPLPFPAPVALRVQLQAAGQCWEATYSDAGVQKNDTVQFKAKSD